MSDLGAVRCLVLLRPPASRSIPCRGEREERKREGKGETEPSSSSIEARASRKTARELAAACALSFDLHRRPIQTALRSRSEEERAREPHGESEKAEEPTSDSFGGQKKAAAAAAMMLSFKAAPAGVPLQLVPPIAIRGWLMRVSRRGSHAAEKKRERLSTQCATARKEKEREAKARGLTLLSLAFSRCSSELARRVTLSLTQRPPEDSAQAGRTMVARVWSEQARARGWLLSLNCR